MSEEEFYNKLKYNFFGTKDSEDFKELVKAYNDKSKKLELYKSIINELEEFLIDMGKIYEEQYEDIDTASIFNVCVLDKLQELEGSDKE